jgi:hypothetical protein
MHRAKCLQYESFEKFGYFRTFLGLIRADSDVLLAVVHPLPNGGGRLVFYAGSKAPL